MSELFNISIVKPHSLMCFCSKII